MANQQGRTGWRDVVQALRRSFGADAPGTRIPTEPELMARHGASRYAVRRALANLEQEGLVRVEHGRGAFVHDGYLVSYRLGDRTRFTDVLLEEQITPAQEVLRIAQAPAEPMVAAALQVEPGAAVLTMESLGYANGQVVKHDVNHFPLPRFAAMPATLQTARSVTAALAAHGVPDYRRRFTSVVGRLPTPAEARLLRQPASRPVFETVRLDIDMQDRPVIFGTTVFSCERVRLVLDRGEPADAVR